MLLGGWGLSDFPPAIGGGILFHALAGVDRSGRGYNPRPARGIYHNRAGRITLNKRRSFHRYRRPCNLFLVFYRRRCRPNRKFGLRVVAPRHTP